MIAPSRTAATLRPVRDWVCTTARRPFGPPLIAMATTLSPSTTKSRTKTIQAIIGREHTVPASRTRGRRSPPPALSEAHDGRRDRPEVVGAVPSPGRRRAGGRGRRRGLLGQGPLELAGVQRREVLDLRR